jgi:hypothetical protein
MIYITLIIIGFALFIACMMWNLYLGDEGTLWKVRLSAYGALIGDILIIGSIVVFIVCSIYNFIIKLFG